MTESSDNRVQRAAFWLAALVLVVVPLSRGGNSPMGGITTELLSLALLGLLLWSPQKFSVSPRLLAFAAAVFALPLLYLLPLPESIAQYLPGRDLYAQALALTQTQTLGGLGQLAVVPTKTEAAWLALIPPLAVFLAAVRLDEDRLLTLVRVLLGVALFQSALGLMQYGAGPDSALNLGMEDATPGAATGTYPNRNHLAGFLNLVIPITLGLLFFNLGAKKAQPDAAAGHWKHRLVFLGSSRGHLAAILVFLAILFLLAIVFSRSRMGIGLAMTGVLVSTVMLSTRMGGEKRHRLTVVLLAVTLGLAITIGLGPVLQRFSSDPMGDARWHIFSGTSEAIGQFLPLGAGPAAYVDVFPRFQPVEHGRFLSSGAHNDYLEWFLEAGVLAAVLLVIFLLLFFYQWSKVWTKPGWSKMRFIQAGAGIGLSLLLLHSFVDFNLRVLANATYAAFLAGLFFRDYRSSESSVRPHRARRHRSKPAEPEPRKPDGPPIGPEPVPQPPAQVPNPFMD